MMCDGDTSEGYLPLKLYVYFPLAKPKLFSNVHFLSYNWVSIMIQCCSPPAPI